VARMGKKRNASCGRCVVVYVTTLSVTQTAQRRMSSELQTKLSRIQSWPDFKVAAWLLLGGNEEDHKMPVRQSMSLSRLEPGTFRV
jgi:hypothetical protein